MRRLWICLALALVACDGRGCAVVAGKVSIAGKVTSGSAIPPLVAFRSAGGMPNSTSGARGVDTVYSRPWYIPTDVTSITIRVGNKYRNGGTGNTVTSNIAVYTSDGTGYPTGSALATYSAQTIPGDGTMLVLGPFSITRGSDGKIVIVHSVPGTIAISVTDNNFVGLLWNSTTTVSPMPSLVSNGGAGQLDMVWELDYSTRRPRIQVFGDSISDGSSGASPPGYESNAWNRLAIDRDFAVAQWGCNASTVDDINTDANFTADILWNNSAWYLEGGTNDLGAGASAATLETRVTTLNTTLTGLSSGHRWINTIAPRAFVGAQETERTAYNTWVRANSLGFTGKWDAAATQLTGGEADNSDATILFSPFSADGLHWTAAGHIQAEGGISAITP